jgi:hypothetical protein
MASLAFSLEKRVAISAVSRACSLTSIVFQNLVKNETLTKGDKSPVTGEQDSGIWICETFIDCILLGYFVGGGKWLISPHKLW